MESMEELSTRFQVSGEESSTAIEAEGEMDWLLPNSTIQSSANVFYLGRANWQGSLGNVVSAI